MGETPRDSEQSRNTRVWILFIIAALFVAWWNLPRVLPRPHSTRALGEIQSTELALTKMVSDAGQSGFSAFFDIPALEARRDAWAARMRLSPLEAATRIYTTATYALLRHGRAAPGILASSSDATKLSDLLNQDVTRHLGTSYLDIASDPWGTDYRIYPGPWREEDGLIPFRTYLGDTRELLPSSPPRVPDMLSRVINDPEDGPTVIGYPAPENLLAFIWSCGENKQNDQPHAGGRGFWHYRNDVLPEELGGGDDINNWDSARSWERHY